MTLPGESRADDGVTYASTADLDRLTLLRQGPLTDMMAAIQARLVLAFPARTFVHQVFPARTTKAVWSKFAERFPAVGLGFVLVAPQASSGRMMQAIAQWSVFLAVKNPKAEGALRGDKVMPGLLPMIQMAAAALHGWTIPGIGTVSVAGMEHGFAEEWSDEAMAVAQLTLAVPFSLTNERVAGSLDDFLEIGIVWPLPSLPGAPETDTVTTINPSTNEEG